MSNIHRLTLVVGVLQEDLPITVENFINAEPDYSMEVQFGDQLYAGIDGISETLSDETGDYSYITVLLTDGRTFAWPIRNGRSPYQIAVSLGYRGTEEEWLVSLIGPKGDAATVRIDRIEMIDENEQPRVVNNGTENDASYVLYLPATKGPKGDVGDGLHISGTYSTYASFIANHPTGTKDEAYIIAGNIYTWSESESEWVNGGRIQGAKGDKGDKGDPLKYEDMTDDDKGDLRQPLMDLVEAARESASDSSNQALLARRAAEESSDSAEASRIAAESVMESIRTIVESGGNINDILAALDIMSRIADMEGVLSMLRNLYPYEVSEDDWDSMTVAQRNAIKEAHTTVYIVEGAASSSGGHSFSEGVLTLSPGSTFIDGILTIADATFVDGILTLNK